jgi:hypothetical protein
MTLVSYFINGRNLCVYQLSSEYLFSKLSFPKATTITLIRCTPKGVSAILQPCIFPALTRINYLSSHPGSYDIHTRFPCVKWIFPNQTHPFYDSMVEAGYGKKDDDLIINYVASKTLPDTYSEDYNLYIPGYGLINGQKYREEQYDFFTNPHRIPVTNNSIQFEYHVKLDHSCSSLATYFPVQYYHKKKMENDFFELLVREDALMH